MRFLHSDDPCLSIFATLWPAQFDFPQHARILEIGCAEADWIGPMTAARPDLKIDGIDWRICKRPAARTLIRGNVLEHDFVPGSYDAIVLISALEHIGLGHYEEDPIDPDGDVRCVERAARWLRRGGLLYFDVPFQPDRYQVLGTECRIYDDATLNTRLWRTLFNQRGRWWTREKNTSTLIPRPTARDPRFYYCACLWEKA